MKLGASSRLDRDVENALWSLNAIYTIRGNFDDLGETNRLALELKGVNSFVAANSYTRMRAYRHLACGELPSALLWAQYLALESIRAGCLMDEIEANRVMARVYGNAGEPKRAVQHAIVGAEANLVEGVVTVPAPWVPFALTGLKSKAVWMRAPSLTAIRISGDLAPPNVARRTIAAILEKLEEPGTGSKLAPDLFSALGSVALEAETDHLDRLAPIIERAAARESGEYRLSDRGVALVAARIYRFRKRFRPIAAKVLAQLATSSHLNGWIWAVGECGNDTVDLIAAIEGVAAHKQVDLSAPLS